MRNGGSLLDSRAALRWGSLLALAPLLWLQGRWVRWRTPRLPEAAGARSGVAGQGPVLRLLVLGDSAAAGVGVPHQQRALAGRLVGALAPHWQVHWSLWAQTGLDSDAVIALAQRQGVQAFDVVVLSVGVNDVTGLCRARPWAAKQARLAQLLAQRFGVHTVVHSAVPPMQHFRALPQPLRWLMGRWAADCNRALEQALQSAPPGPVRRLWLAPLPPGPGTDLASDGFHPGALSYALWAQAVAVLVQNVPHARNTSA